MTKRPKGRLNQTVHRFGAGLGDLAMAYAEWMKQRDVIASELRDYLSAARKMLADMGHDAEVAVARAVTNVGSRRQPGSDMPAETIQEVPERTKARPSRRKVRKPERNVSPEVRAKLARLARERWAKAKKAGKTRLG